MTADALADELLTLWRMIRQRSQIRNDDGLTQEQFWLLRHLHDDGPSSVGQLATALGISASSATTACKRLERDGLVTRQRRDADERVVQVALTSDGAQRVQESRRRRHEQLADLLGALDEREQGELHALIRRLVTAAREHGYERSR